MATEFPNYYGVNLGIAQSGSTGNYSYSVIGTGNVPVFDVSWGSAARFCNWLENGQPIGVEGTGTTETGAYTLNGATSNTALMTITRNGTARYVIPTDNEWYKAAYYMGGGTSAGYWDYPTESNPVPSNVLSRTEMYHANYYNGGYTDPTNYLTTVGYFGASPGPYGTYDQGGDVWQWDEMVVGGASDARRLRGGSFRFDSDGLAALSRYGIGNTYGSSATAEWNDVGFRVASVPEPGSIALLGAAGIGLLVATRSSWRRRLVRVRPSTGPPDPSPASHRRPRRRSDRQR